MQMALVERRFGRVLLHLWCAARDRNYRWHWEGIRREFTGAIVVRAASAK
jgi:hypothetical protein